MTSRYVVYSGFDSFIHAIEHEPCHWKPVVFERELTGEESTLPLLDLIEKYKEEVGKLELKKMGYGDQK